MMSLADFGMHVRKANRKAGNLFVIVRNFTDATRWLAMPWPIVLLPEYSRRARALGSATPVPSPVNPDTAAVMTRLVATLLICAPFLLGLNRPLLWSLWALVLALAFLWPDREATRHHRQPLRSTPQTAAMMVSAVAFALVLPLVQLSGGICADLSSAHFCVTNPEQSWLSLAFALMLMLWFLLLTGAKRPSTSHLLMALTIAGAVHALYGLITFSLGITPLFLDNVFHHENVPTGGFPNRNHLAAFLYIAIFAGIALVIRLPADTGTGRAGRWRFLLDQRLLWRLSIVLMVLALIATRSRAGNAAFLIGFVAGFAWLLLVERRRSDALGKSLRWRFVLLVFASVLTLDALLVGSFVGLEKLQQRMTDTSLESEQRDDVNKTLLAHQELFTPLGHGAASFLPVFETVKPAKLHLFYLQAHNDYLQVLVERGWAGALLLATTLSLALWQALQAGNNGQGAEARFALVAATAALLAHAGVEFVTQIPAIWLAWLTVLAIALCDRNHSLAGARTHRHQRSKRAAIKASK